MDERVDRARGASGGGDRRSIPHGWNTRFFVPKTCDAPDVTQKIVSNCFTMTPRFTSSKIWEKAPPRQKDNTWRGHNLDSPLTICPYEPNSLSYAHRRFLRAANKRIALRARCLQRKVAGPNHADCMTLLVRPCMCTTSLSTFQTSAHISCRGSSLIANVE